LNLHTEPTHFSLDSPTQYDYPNNIAVIDSEHMDMNAFTLDNFAIALLLSFGEPKGMTQYLWTK